MKNFIGLSLIVGVIFSGVAIAYATEEVFVGQAERKCAEAVSLLERAQRFIDKAEQVIAKAIVSGDNEAMEYGRYAARKGGSIARNAERILSENKDAAQIVRCQGLLEQSRVLMEKSRELRGVQMTEEGQRRMEEHRMEQEWKLIQYGY